MAYSSTTYSFKVHNLHTAVANADGNSDFEDSEINMVHTVSAHATKQDKIVASFIIKDTSKRIRLQLDSGATCNVLHVSSVPTGTSIKNSNTTLVTYNKTKMRPLVDAHPIIHPPRKVPIALKDKLKTELDRLEHTGVIQPVTDEATPWVNSIVVVDRPNKTRVCLDPRDLNKVIKRRHYRMPTIDDILPHMHNAKIFCVLAKDGYCQIKLTKKSSRLTTFNSPFGRYRYLRLPFGLISASEEYQRSQDQSLQNLEGVKTIVDDILVIGTGDTMEDVICNHNKNLANLMKRATAVDLKLNKHK
ncbi:uncharacterized protein K02A2.6-like [Anneissia japonica]|uniref:uncharacterized protein K02A2.6-like n=1 Tax=Anneissia japonica TaxID=1529436 RepID=UPI0014257127|nr:uncharacterized protein K02A2.6-like [Anneissia japonica]